MGERQPLRPELRNSVNHPISDTTVRVASSRHLTVQKSRLRLETALYSLLASLLYKDEVQRETSDLSE